MSDSFLKEIVNLGCYPHRFPYWSKSSSLSLPTSKPIAIIAPVSAPQVSPCLATPPARALPALKTSCFPHLAFPAELQERPAFSQGSSYHFEEPVQRFHQEVVFDLP